MRLLPVSAVTLLGFMVACISPAMAAEIEFAYEGVIRAVDADLASNLPAGSGVEAGSRMIVKYVFESTTADIESSTSSGVYQGALVSLTIEVGEYRFDHDPGGSLNEIDVVTQFGVLIYQPVDSVIATPALPVPGALEAVVFFLSVNDFPLEDDTLPIVSPDPLNPGWQDSDMALYDVDSVLLIDFDIETLCDAPCILNSESPPNPVPTPVPTGIPLGLAAALMLAGLRQAKGRVG